MVRESGCSFSRGPIQELTDSTPPCPLRRLLHDGSVYLGRSVHGGHWPLVPLSDELGWIIGLLLFVGSLIFSLDFSLLHFVRVRATRTCPTFNLSSSFAVGFGFQWRFLSGKALLTGSSSQLASRASALV